MSNIINILSTNIYKNSNSRNILKSSLLLRNKYYTTTTSNSNSILNNNNSSISNVELKLSNKINYPKQSSFALTDKKPEVCIGLSGGVDSAVTAYLLKKQGFKVHCVYIKSWDEKDELGYCTGERDYNDALYVANQLDLPIYHADFVKEYWNRVFNSFLEEYSQGYTPNPDVFCNREIKFDVFYDYAKNIGADFIATGHYSRLNYNDNLESAQLLRGLDRNKDQSYFLCMTEGYKLYRALFPIGAYNKPDIKHMANELGYQAITAKTSSRGICFVGKRPLDEFLGTYLQLTPGSFVNNFGQTIGKHKGAICYTIGQKANISGLEERHIIYKIDQAKNNVYVCPESQSKKYLMSQSLKIHRVNWIAGNMPETLANGGTLKVRGQVRYRANLIDAEITLEKRSSSPNDNNLEDIYSVRLKDAERAVAPGQILCIYEQDSDVCLGGGSVGFVRTFSDVIGPLADSSISFPMLNR